MESGDQDCSQFIWKKKKNHIYIYFNILWLTTCDLTCRKSIKRFPSRLHCVECSLFVHRDQLRLLRRFASAARCRATPLQLQKRGLDFCLCLKREGPLSMSLWKAVEPRGSCRQERSLLDTKRPGLRSSDLLLPPERQSPDRESEREAAAVCSCCSSSSLVGGAVP